MLRMPDDGSCHRGRCAAGLRRSSGGSCRRGGEVWLGSGGLAVETAAEVDVQLGSGCLVVEAAAEVEV